LSISWREILGLLVGLAICYGVISYTLTYASLNREAALERTQQNSQQGSAEQQTTPEVTDQNTKTMTVRVTGSKGEPFGANYGNLTSGQTVEGVLPRDYEVRVRTDPLSGDYVSATAWKNTGNSKELKVQLVDNGSVIRENSTTKDYGVTGVRWSPNDPPPEETTTASTKKTEEDDKPPP
jgi:hypothetical protein